MERARAGPKERGKIRRDKESEGDREKEGREQEKEERFFFLSSLFLVTYLFARAISELRKREKRTVDMF
jgi:hypothetical protein